jgi:hypothetical protein
MKKETDWRRWASDTLCRAGRRSGGLSSTVLALVAPGQCGELVLPTLRWQWSVRVAGGGDLPC